VLSKVSLAWIGALAVLPGLALAADDASPRSVEAVAPDAVIVALADSLPTASIESICRDAQSAALPESKTAAYQACVHDERAAYDQLRQKWPRYSAKARVTCAEPGGGAQISYVELQTCLDMQPGGSLTVEGPAPRGAPALDPLGDPSVAPRPGQKQ
jgi:hypothetical protein